MKRIVLILIISFSFMSSLEAECPYSDVVKYNELANYIESNYKYNRETNKFDLVFYNVDHDLNINNTYIPTNNEITISGYDPGSLISVDVYLNNENCYNELVRNISFILPYYNNFYNDERCNNKENLEVCKYEFLPYNLDEVTFYRLINAGDSSFTNEKEDEEKEETIIIEENVSILDKLMDNGLLLIIIVLISSLVTFIICNIIYNRIKNNIKHGF